MNFIESIEKSGLDEDAAESIKKIQRDFIADGFSVIEAGKRAAKHYLYKLVSERNSLIKQLPEDLIKKHFSEPGDSDHVHYYRAKNSFEKRIDFQKIDDTLTSMEKQTFLTLRSILVDSRDQIVKRYGGKTVTEKMIRSVKTVPNMGKYKTALNEFMVETMEGGRSSFRNDIAGVFKFKDEGPNFTPTAAISHLKTKAIDLASTTNDAIIKDVKRVLMTSLETGATGRETAEGLKEVFEPWVGDPTLKRGQEQLKPHRLENIVRTESTNAFNQGRLVEARRPGIVENMRGMEYSAIIDARTTDVCLKLDGRVFKMSDPQLDNLRPPNHFMCRSILVPVTIFDEVNESDFVTPTVAGQAVQLAGKGFVKP
jgi:SPP1 gp7 family putative phage head morphogenesis protein